MATITGNVTFTVASRDESMATAERLGAVVISSDDTDWTKTALIRDPQGAELTLSQFTPPGADDPAAGTTVVVLCQLSSAAQVDGWVNVDQTSGVIELSEQTVIEQLVERLSNRYPAISQATVASVVLETHARFDGRPLRDFIPLLVERNAKSALERLGATAV